LLNLIKFLEQIEETVRDGLVLGGGIKGTQLNSDLAVRI
jgi:glycerol-3-phosphate dehydrogenase